LGDTPRIFQKKGIFFQMGVPPVRVNFDECWEKKIEVDFDDIKVQDLIVSKRAAGRPQDLIDADLLSKGE